MDPFLGYKKRTHGHDCRRLAGGHRSYHHREYIAEQLCNDVLPSCVSVSGAKHILHRSEFMAYSRSASWYTVEAIDLVVAQYEWHVFARVPMALDAPTLKGLFIRFSSRFITGLNLEKLFATFSLSPTTCQHFAGHWGPVSCLIPDSWFLSEGQLSVHSVLQIFNFSEFSKIMDVLLCRVDSNAASWHGPAAPAHPWPRRNDQCP